MPKSDYRIGLWRNTIQLFYQYKKSNFIGPFKAAGFNYIVEPLFLSSEEGNDLEPDIVASGETGWFILELTTKPKSKEPQLDRYKTIDPRDLSQYGLNIHDGQPDVMTSRLSYIDDGPYCQITVNKVLELKNENYLNNHRLKNELSKAKNKDLTRLPEIPITIVPEMKSQEIRRGLIDIVMQLFDPNNDGKTPVEMVDEGLERLSNKIRPNVRRKLIDKVKNEMNTLIKNHLPDYLELEDGKYRSTEKFKQHHKRMEHIAFKLKKWAGEIPPTSILDF